MGTILKKALFVALTLLPVVLFAQQNTGTTGQDSPQKYALVIGNSTYTGLTPLANPVNDANDIAAVLEYLGFNVDKVLNGNLEQMENAVMRLKENLEAADKGYGFFFYAGHGVQSGGENFLIPVNANIPSENALRNRAMSVQMVLDDLNDARNGLNVVVLDACRDNPFGWSRGGTRGLSIVTRQPADSIIVYATSAGQQASDGDGRNGLFTSQLIQNLATPGIEVKEVFNRTGQDVANVSRNQQIPAIYSQFFGSAWLGEKPDGLALNTSEIGRPQIIIGRARTEREPEKFWSVGASVGTCFVDPWVVGTVRGTIAPLKYSFLDLGVDIGLVSGYPDVGYYSFCPFVHAAYFRPINSTVGVYGGAGGSYMMAQYSFPKGDTFESAFGIDVIAGISLFSMVDVSFTFRTNFTNVSSKLSLGYTYRF